MATPDLVRTRDRLAGAGAAVGVRAPFEAVEEAVEALGRDPGLVLIFPTGVLDPQEAATQAQAAAGERARRRDDRDRRRSRPAVRSRAAARRSRSTPHFRSEWAPALPPTRAPPGALPPPRLCSASTATEATPRSSCSSTRSRATRLRSSPGPTRSRVGASRSREEPPAAGQAQFADGEAVVGERGRRRPRQQDADRCRHFARLCASRSAVDRHPLARPRRAPTRRPPAEAVYLEKLGMGDVPLSDADFEAIAMAHPLAQPELRGDVRPRYVRGRAPGGGLVCATSIEANAAVDVCEHKPEAIVRSARRRSTKRWGSFPARPRPSCSSTALQGVSGSAIRSPRARSSRSSPRSAIRRPRWRALHAGRDRTDPRCERRPEL